MRQNISPSRVSLSASGIYCFCAGSARRPGRRAEPHRGRRRADRLPGGDPDVEVAMRWAQASLDPDQFRPGDFGSARRQWADVLEACLVRRPAEEDRVIFRQDASPRYCPGGTRRAKRRSALPRDLFSSMAHIGGSLPPATSPQACRVNARLGTGAPPSAPGDRDRRCVSKFDVCGYPMRGDVRSPLAR